MRMVCFCSAVSATTSSHARVTFAPGFLRYVQLSSISSRLRSGDLDVVEHLDAYLDTIDRLDGDIGAVVSGTLSRGRLYRECRQLAER